MVQERSLSVFGDDDRMRGFPRQSGVSRCGIPKADFSVERDVLAPDPNRRGLESESKGRVSRNLRSTKGDAALFRGMPTFLDAGCFGCGKRICTA